MLRRRPYGILLALAVLMALVLAPAGAFAQQSLTAAHESGQPPSAVRGSGQPLSAVQGSGQSPIAVQEYINADYIALDGNTITKGDAQRLTSSMNVLDGGFNGGWWVVTDNVTMSQRLDIKGDTNIILGNGTTLSATDGICINPGATLTIWANSENRDEVGKLRASSSNLSGIGSNPGTIGGALIVNGGDIHAQGAEESAGIGGSAEGRLESATINTGWVTAKAGSSGAGIGGGYKGDGFSITINGGSVHAEGDWRGAGIGGGERRDDHGGAGGGCVINGGTVYAKGGEEAAGIGGGRGEGTSTSKMSRSGGVTINGGTVHVQGGRGAAGIGGGWLGYADGLTFNGGTVETLASDYGAGIGGGYKGHSTQIWVNGGTVVAKSCENFKEKGDSNYYSGAGIGGGWQGDFSGEMIVTGGKITAIAARGGAGIGAGCQGNMTGSLKVTGGEVYAYGGRSGKSGVDPNANRGGAGIGGGEEIKSNTGGEGGTVAIEGGKVVACGGGGWQCAIGHGHNDSVMGSLTIADHMWSRWTNEVTLSARDLATWTYSESTIDESSLVKSGVDWRKYDAQHRRYIIIEPCPHPEESATPTAGRYTDISPEKHLLNFTCPYCKVGYQGATADHVFGSGSNGHECVCGHSEHRVIFYSDEEGTQVYAPEKYYSDGTKVDWQGYPNVHGLDYTFQGWFEKLDGHFADYSYDFDAPVSRDLELYAKWTPTVVSHAVGFHDDDGKLLSTQQVEHGQKATRPADPAPKENWAFAGWFKREGGQYIGEAFDFDTAITEDTNLYHKWTPNSSATTHTVTFDSRGGSEIPPQTVAEGDTVDTEGIIPTRDAGEGDGWWLFEGWCSDTGCTQYYNLSAPVTSDFTLYAKWLPRSEADEGAYVTFDPNGGMLAGGTVSPRWLPKGDRAPMPTEPTRGGWLFHRWQLNGEDYDWNATVEQDITLVADWRQPCTVTFDVEGGGIAPQTVASGEKAKRPPDPTNEGYRFAGWYLGDDLYDFATPVRTSIVLTAHWVRVHTVTFDAQQGTEIPPQIVDEGGTVSTEGITPTRAPAAGENEWLFAGWYSNAGCTQPYNFSTPVTSDFTLYAKWVQREPDTNVYVTFDPNGGTLAADTQEHQEVVRGQKALPPEQPPTKEGAAFDGWKLDGEDYDWNAPVNEDITLVAAWEQWVTITFDTAGGTEVEPQRILSGTEVTRPADPTRAGYAFLGWFSDEADGPDPWNFDEYQVIDDLTLYAQWEEVPGPAPGPAPDPTKQMGEDGTALGRGASAEAADAALARFKSEKDPAGTVYAGVMLKASKAKKTSVKLTWKKAAGARSYVVYGGTCGKKTGYSKVAVVPGSKKSATVKKVAGKKVAKGTYYRFVVVALTGPAGTGEVVSASKPVHVATAGGKAGNHGKVTTKAKKGKLSLKEGKSFKLRARAVPASKRLKVKVHRKLAYQSSNPKVAKVSRSGKVTAQAKGACYVYAYAQNGVAAKVKVKVKVK